MALYKLRLFLCSGLFIHSLARLTLILFIKGNHAGYGIRWRRDTVDAAGDKQSRLFVTQAFHRSR